MGELNEMLKRVDLERMMSYLIYDTNMNAEVLVNSEEKMKQSFDAFLSKLRNLYPEIEQENEELFDVVAEMLAAHEDAYFMSGVLVGFQFYKNMEQGYEHLQEGEEEEEGKLE